MEQEQDSPQGSQQEAPPAPASPPSKAEEKPAAGLSKAERRERDKKIALAAVGKAKAPEAPAAAPADTSADDADDTDDPDDDDDSDGEGEDAGAGEGALEDARDAWKKGDDEALAKALGLEPETVKLVKRGPKHARRLLAKVDARLKEFKESRGERTREQAEDANRLARANTQFGPIAEAISHYHHGRKGEALVAIEKMFKKPFATLAREFYEESREGASTTELRRELEAVKAEIASRSGKEKEDGEKAAKASEEQKTRAAFDKRIKGHGLHARDEDNELADRAYKLYRDSWDEDLGEYAITPKQAADKVLDKETRRAARVLGSAPKPRATAERSEAPAPPKARAAMSKQERREYDKQVALARVDAGKRAERRASL